MHRNMGLFLLKRKANSLDLIKKFQRAYYIIAISILQSTYLGFAWPYYEYVKIAGIAAYCKPATLTIESY